MFEGITQEDRVNFFKPLSFQRAKLASSGVPGKPCPPPQSHSLVIHGRPVRWFADTQDSQGGREVWDK